MDKIFSKVVGGTTHFLPQFLLADKATGKHLPYRYLTKAAAEVDRKETTATVIVVIDDPQPGSVDFSRLYDGLGGFWLSTGPFGEVQRIEGHYNTLEAAIADAKALAADTEAEVTVLDWEQIRGSFDACTVRPPITLLGVPVWPSRVA
ncbi:MAG: hypothetical protein WAX89_07500 [Alphaproteobacteria bacterium]